MLASRIEVLGDVSGVGINTMNTLKDLNIITCSQLHSCG
jgi:hypothetical protein